MTEAGRDPIRELLDLAEEVSFMVSVASTVLAWDTLATLDAVEPLTTAEGRVVIGRIRDLLEAGGTGS